jgi:hypothetical protein
MEKPCGKCQASKQAKQLINTLNKINGYENIDTKRKHKSLNKTIYVFIKYFLYTILIITLFIFSIPILLFIIFNKKGIVIKLPNLNKYRGNVKE